MTVQVPTDTKKFPASIEMLPKQTPPTGELAALLPRGTRVYLTDIGSAETDSDMLMAGRRLREVGCVPVPHFAARRIASRAVLEKRIGRLAEEAGAVEALHSKKAFADRTDARPRIVTQFGFDAEKAIAWAENLSFLGLDMPVHIGVAGPAKIMTLIKYGTLCGVGNSLSMLTRHAGNLMSLATGYSPDTFVAPLERQRRARIAQIHVFPFGGLDKASAWLRRRGSWSPL